jgi:predicted DsbA family dithiol-disulfide isomerase
MMDDILELHKDEVKVVVKNFPLSFHKQARLAAKYALAASRQGKYKEMYHMIMENFRKLKTNEDLPLEYAQELGLNMAQFKADAKDPAWEELIKIESKQLQDNFERKSVPKFLVAGQEPKGRDLATFSTMIRAELEKKGIKSKAVPIGSQPK